MYTQKSKQKGFARAYRLLAFMYSSGEYVIQDKAKAIECFEESIKRGDFSSYCFQGDIYGELGDHNKQMELYHKAAELAENDIIKTGDPFYKLAIAYEDGVAVEQDLEKAVSYFLKAAERNYSRALIWTVPCIKKLDEHKRIGYLEEAYKLNCEGAAYQLGMIEKGHNVLTILPPNSKGIKYFETGAEAGDIQCVDALLVNYSWILGYAQRNQENRSASLKWFSFFFANAPKDYLEHLRKHDLLAVYYTAYAVDLDYDPYSQNPDREFVMYYFKKGILESPRQVGGIIMFATQCYLFPGPNELKVDVQHAEELLNLALEYWGNFYSLAHKTKPENATDIVQEYKNSMIKGFDFISECYRKGRHVKKDRAKSKKYKNINDEITRREQVEHEKILNSIPSHSSSLNIT